MNFRRGVFVACLALSNAAASHGQQVGPLSTHNPNRLEAIPIVIRLEGFDRQQMSLPVGIYLLAVINRSGLKGLQTVLELMPGNSVAGSPLQQLFDAAVDPVAGRTLQQVQLAAGTYRLREVHHSQALWTVEIQVK